MTLAPVVAADSKNNSLGYLDSSTSLLEINLHVTPQDHGFVDQSLSSNRLSARSSRRSGSEHQKIKGNEGSRTKEIVVNLKLHQDLTALKGGGGDTGKFVR